MFHVLGATDLSLPPGQDPGSSGRPPACGLDFEALSPA
jgi:hypothetical protein